MLSGAISHITGTSSTTYVTDSGKSVIDRYNAVDSALPTGWYPLHVFTLTWTIVADIHYTMAGLPNGQIIRSTDFFTFNGDANAYCIINVIEEEEPRERGKRH